MMYKNFKYIYILNILLIVSWIIFAIFIFTSIPFYWSLDPTGIVVNANAILALSSIMIIFAFICAILNILIGVMLIIFCNNIPNKHKRFLLACGILLFFFTLSVSCTINNRVKKLSSPSEYPEGFDNKMKEYKIHKLINKNFYKNTHDQQQAHINKNNLELELIKKIGNAFNLKQIGVINETQFLNLKQNLLEIICN